MWRGGVANKTYEWYALVTDAFGNTFRTSPRTFTTSPNISPVASNQNVTVIGDQPASLTLLGSDSNGDALAFKTNSFPIRGLLSNLNTNNGSITYTPARGYRGSDSFTYFVNDGFANSSAAAFNLTVVAPSDTNANGIADAWEAAYLA